MPQRVSCDAASMRRAPRFFALMARAEFKQAVDEACHAEIQAPATIQREKIANAKAGARRARNALGRRWVLDRASAATRLLPRSAQVISGVRRKLGAPRPRIQPMMQMMTTSAASVAMVRNANDIRRLKRLCPDSKAASVASFRPDRAASGRSFSAFPLLTSATPPPVQALRPRR